MTLAQLRDIVEFAKQKAELDNAEVIAMEHVSKDPAFYRSRQLAIFIEILNDLEELGKLMEISSDEPEQQIFFLTYESLIEFMEKNTYGIYGRLYRENYNRQPSFYQYLGELRKIAAFDLFTTSMIQVSYNYLVNYFAFNEDCGDNDLFGNLIKP